jgi:outer membrane murein-binding lipoprotein Lpp
VIAPQLTKLHEYKKQLLTEKRQKMKQLSLNAQQLNTEVNQLNSRVTMDLRHNQSALLLTQEKLKKLTEVDDQHKNSVASLRDLINEVNLLITNTLVFSKSYMTAFSGDPELRNLKAEIKGLKGTLLSKNNFPAPTSMFAKKPSFVKIVVYEPKVSDSLKKKKKVEKKNVNNRKKERKTKFHIF